MTDTTNYGSVNTQITRQDPNIEKYRRALLADVQQFIANQVQTPQANMRLSYKVGLMLL